MDKILELTSQLKEEIDNLPLFQEYLRVKKLINESKELEGLKKEIALAKIHHDDQRHKELLDQYNSHPLIVNCESLKAEVYDYLKQISEIVNKK